VRTCHQLLPVADGPWTFLDIEGVAPTNNAAEQALCQSVFNARSAMASNPVRGAIYRSRLLTVTTTKRQQGWDVWVSLEQAWSAHHSGGVISELLIDP
jgi:hypothetical protein